MLLKFTTLVMFVVLSFASAVQAAGEDFLKAISWVESRHNDNAVGDGGKAIGRYQIWEIYWIDAVKSEHWLGARGEQNRYARCKEAAYAAMVVKSYLNRYAPDEYELVFVLGVRDMRAMEKLARIHNGGPRGHTKKATEPYWAKVKAELLK